MTKEDILRTLKSILAEINESENAVCYVTSEDREVIKSAIKALEQDCVGTTQECVVNALDMRCEDCISRQAVKEQMIKYGFHAPDMTVTEFVEDLPSVNPQKNIVNNGTMNITL